MSVRRPICIRCTTPEEARRTVQQLLDRRVQPHDIQVISSEPIHGLAAQLSGKSRLPIFAITGAMLGIGAGFLLASGTARLYPIHTGGMPIVSLLPVGIVTYESMMLFAVLASLAGLLLEAKLLHRRSREIRAFTGSASSTKEILVITYDIEPQCDAEKRTDEILRGSIGRR